MADISIDVYQSDGTTFVGAATNIEKFSGTREVNAIGGFSFSVPLTARYDVSLMQGLRVLEVNVGYDGNEYTIIRGVIVEVKRSRSDGKRVMTVKCQDEGFLLKKVSALVGREWDDTAAGAIASQLVGLTTGWTATSTKTTTIDMSLRAENVWAALKLLAERTGQHMRLGSSAKTIELGEFGSDSGVVLFGGVDHPVSGSYQIVQIDQVDRSDDIVNEIVPFMAGSTYETGGLGESTRSSPYAITTIAGANGETLYSVKDTDSINAYGLSRQMLRRSDIAPVDDTEGAKVDAANVLYDVAVADLEDKKDPIEAYNVAVKGIAILTSADVLPGDKVHLLYQEFDDDDGTAITVLDIDASYYVQRIKIDVKDGVTTTFELVKTLRARQNFQTDRALGAFDDLFGGFDDFQFGEFGDGFLPGYTPPPPGFTDPDIPELDEPPETIPPGDPGSGGPRIGDDQGQRWCRTGEYIAEKFFDLLQRVQGYYGTAADETEFEGELQGERPNVLTNYSILTDTNISDLYGLNATNLNSQLTTANEETFRDWLRCRNGAVTGDEVALWIENSAGYGTELTSAGTILAPAIADATWAAWRAAGSRTKSSACTACSDTDTAFVWDSSGVYRTTVLSIDGTGEEWQNVSPQSAGVFYDFAREGSDGVAYCLTYKGGQSRLWRTDDVFGHVVTWEEQQVVDGRYTSLALSSTVGEGWIYTNNTESQRYNLLDGDGFGALEIITKGVWATDTIDPTGTYDAVNDRVVSGDAGTFSPADGRRLDGAVVRLAVEPEWIGLPVTANFTSDGNNPNSPNAYGFIRAYDATDTLLTSVSNASANNITDLDVTLSAIPNNTTYLEFSIRGLVNGSTPKESYINSIQIGADNAAATRFFSSDGDAIGADVTVGAPLDGDGTISASGTTAFAPCADGASDGKVRSATSGGAYSDYQSLTGAQPVTVLAESGSVAWFTTDDDKLYRDSSDVTPSGWTPTPDSQILTIAGGRLFALGFVGGARVVRYSDNNGVTWDTPSGSINDAATAIVANATDDLLIATQDLDGANGGENVAVQRGDVAGTVNTYAGPAQKLLRGVAL